MPSVKKSVMFSDQTVAYIKARTREENEISWSQALNEGFKALAWLTKQSLPELSDYEWQMLMNVYAGRIIKFTPPFRIASDMMDDRGEISIETLEKVDQAYTMLVRKMHGLSQIEQFAVLDFIQKFWARDWNDCKDWGEIYSKIIAL